MIARASPAVHLRWDKARMSAMLRDVMSRRNVLGFMGLGFFGTALP